MPEGNAMGKSAKRFSTLGMLVVGAVALALPGTAAAASPDPTLPGSCDATLGGTGRDLTLDAGAPVRLPGILTVGLGSDSAPTGAAQRNPLLSVPADEATTAIGVRRAPVVGDTAAAACDGTQALVNGTGDTTQVLLVGAVPASTGGTPRPAPPGQRHPGPKPAPAQPGSDVAQTGPAEAGGFVAVGSSALPASPSGSAPLLAAMIPPGPPLLAPSLGTPPDNRAPEVFAQNSGSAQPLPSANAPARLPLLLASLALALVVGALVRTWMRRKLT
jgi:hypothetical protein